MSVFQKRLHIHSRGHGHVQDITSLVESLIEQSGILQGVVNVFNVGSTAAVGTLEYEPGLSGDLPNVLDKLIPPGRDYGHEAAWQDGNAHSHLQASVLGPGLTVPIYKGRLLLGTWQQIVHVECDVKPRSREVVVTIVGE